MHAPQQVSIFLNNALQATHLAAELESDTALPETIRDMPDQVTGHFVSVDSATAKEISLAWKRVMILNPTQVLYSFTYDPQTSNFTARKR